MEKRKRTLSITPLLRAAYELLREQADHRADYRASTGIRELAIQSGVNVRLLYRFLAAGEIDVFWADKLACGLGTHPFLLWGEEWLQVDDIPERDALLHLGQEMPKLAAPPALAGLMHCVDENARFSCQHEDGTWVITGRMVCGAHTYEAVARGEDYFDCAVTFRNKVRYAAKRFGRQIPTDAIVEG
ncbi:MAG: hypothetical protein ACYC3G_00720 [Minisyncoccota bacterium]